MIPFSFTYLVPDTLKEAADAYSEIANQGKKPLYYSGGTEIITMGRVNSLRFDALIDLKYIPEMKGIKKEKSQFFIGAAETLNSVAIWNGFPLLTKCCQRIADHTSQCKITLGGNIAGTVIYHESVLPLFLSNAKAEVYGPKGSRTAKITELFAPQLKLMPGEFLVRFSFEKKYTSLPYVHAKHVDSEKIGYPLLTLAAIRQGNGVEAAVSGLYRYPVLLHLPLLKANEKLPKMADWLLSQWEEPPLNDISGSCEYRLFILKEALQALMDTLGGKAS